MPKTCFVYSVNGSRTQNLVTLVTFLNLVLNINSIFAQEQLESELAKINRELENPLAKRWSLVFQENLVSNGGTAINGSPLSNVLFFQPALPIPFGRNMVFTARPVFPLVTNPDFQSDPTGSSITTGFGDIQIAVLLGPGNATGWVWGLGGSFVFPTATSSQLGNGKYQAGPALMVFYLTKTWTKGIFIQHWWSYAGEELRGEVNRTDLQYIFRRNFGVWSLGLGPTITFNWLAERNDRVTLPIGLGYTRTVRLGKLPVKMRLEPQYNLVRPQSYGAVWNLRFQLAPVIKSPFL